MGEPALQTTEIEHVDVLILGAGLSGIGAACHLREHCPQKSFAILEAREAIGGTWDLFRYPGIRSDSDMFTLGYSFRPWEDSNALADGSSIREYVRDTARDHGVEQAIRFGHRAVRAEWSSADARWTVEALRADTQETVRVSCDFLYACTGYYRYDEGYTPQFPGRERFQGTFVHPQHWPEDLDCAGKRVVVIGSGATAVTLVPALAELGAEVTMLQRSPSYVLSIPGKDVIADFLRKRLPAKLAYSLVRAKNVTLATLIYQLCRLAPDRAAKLIRRLASNQLPEHFDVDTHFKPSYDPWDQRLCLVPDGDLFKALHGNASIATGKIETFTEHGIAARLGRAARGRRDRRRDRLEPADARRPRAERRRKRRRRRQHCRLQGHDAGRRAEYGDDARLHERVLDAEGRPRRAVRLPRAQPHGRSAGWRSRYRRRPTLRCRPSRRST